LSRFVGSSGGGGATKARVCVQREDFRANLPN
jgi:hypothetical protein